MGKRAIEDAHGLAICILGIGYSWFMCVWVKVIFHDRVLCLELFRWNKRYERISIGTILLRHTVF